MLDLWACEEISDVRGESGAGCKKQLRINPMNVLNSLNRNVKLRKITR